MSTIKCFTIIPGRRYFRWRDSEYTITHENFDINEDTSVNKQTKKFDIRLMLLRVDRDSLLIIREFVGPLQFACSWLCGLEYVAMTKFNLISHPKTQITTLCNLIIFRVFHESQQEWCFHYTICKWEI